MGFLDEDSAGPRRGCRLGNGSSTPRNVDEAAARLGDVKWAGVVGLYLGYPGRTA